MLGVAILMPHQCIHSTLMTPPPLAVGSPMSTLAFPNTSKTNSRKMNENKQKKITFKPKYKITIMKTPKLVQRLPYGFVLLPSPTAWLRWDGRRALIVLGLVWVLLAGGGTIGFWRTTVFRLCSNSVLPWVTRCMLRSCDFSDPGTFVKFNSLYLSLTLKTLSNELTTFSIISPIMPNMSMNPPPCNRWE